MNKIINLDNSRLIPVLPLRDIVVYPGIVVPLFVGRSKSINAINVAMDNKKQLFLVTQKQASIDAPNFNNLYKIGTLANILQIFKLPDGTVKVLVESRERCKVIEYQEFKSCYTANLIKISDQSVISEQEQEVLKRVILDSFDKYIKLNNKINRDALNSLTNINDLSRLADTIATHMTLKIKEKQTLLETQDVAKRLEILITYMEGESDLLEVEKRIRSRVKKQMEGNQREYYLNEQMKAIQKELGDMNNATNEIEELEKKVVASGMSKDAKKKADAEINKLKLMSPMSAEATVIRNYIDCLVSMPWKKKTKVTHDIQVAEKVLEADHYGLKKVKERILEYLAVQQRVKKLKGPIICLVGPPGVGKTSLGRSIAKATNRKYIRMALGGVRDEAEIRGHRRTYIGSMPGKILQNLSKVKTKNPLFLLDEIDKVAADFRGDPSSALLEVLDPEQNHAFTDHYLDNDFDLSDVMFVATANTINIPHALLDRMEVIRLSGYTEDEKVNIARRFLITKQIKNNGLKAKEIAITESVIRNIIRLYTREAGVRGLEREISKICRKVVKDLLLKPSATAITITDKNLHDYLGVKRFSCGLVEKQDQVGQVTGLAWTEVGGELLTIETAIMPGKGKQSATGKLGDVMKESIEAALTVVRSRSEALGIEKEMFQKHDIHIHVPEGATPKDGPSAGIGMCAAMISAFTKIPIKSNVAMTGEITLRGEILPIGGLKEKLLAAHRGGITTVLIPLENKKDLAEMPENVKKNLDIRLVRWIDEVLEIALQYMPSPMKNAAEIVADTSGTKKDKSTIVAH